MIQRVLRTEVDVVGGASSVAGAGIPHEQTGAALNAADERTSAVARLRMLLKSEPASVEQVAEWYRQAESLKRVLQSSAALTSVPHVIWHYLDDADIRLRDRAYAQEQIMAVEESIQNMLLDL